jgi:protein BCP1
MSGVDINDDGGKKRKRSRGDDESSCSESEGENDSHFDSTQELQVDFEAKSITDEDHSGIQRLLRQLFLKAPLDLSNITDAIIHQSSSLGSVIKTCHGDDDECDSEDIHDEVLAITTALTVKQQPSLCDYLLTKCTTDQDKDSFEKLIKANTIVVLHERFLNLPVAIGPPLLDCLQKEIEETFKGDLPSNVIFITHSHLIPQPHMSKRKRKLKQVKRKKEAHNFIYEFSEMEYFKKENTLEFNYSVVNERDTLQLGGWGEEDVQAIPHRSVFVLTYQSFKNITNRLNEEEFDINL